MSRAESHLIDEEAEKVLVSSLPTLWVKRKQVPDYHIDYRVEVYDGSERSGIAFDVQIKGETRLRVSKSHALHRIEVRYLVEYADRIRDPVFIIVVDVTNKIGYWLFAQQYIEEQLKGQDWRRKSTVTIRLPTPNLLNDTLTLRAAVEAASRYMARRHPVAVRAAVDAAVARLEALDSRFRVEMAVKGKDERFTLHAKEDVSAVMCLKGSPERRRELYAKMIEKGLPIDLSPGEIEITGSPLLESLKPIAKAEAARKVQGTATIRRIDAKGSERGIIPGLIFSASGGTKEFRVVIDLPYGLGCLRVRISAGHRAAESNFGIDFSRWFGTPVLDLPLFDRMDAVLGNWDSGDVIEVEYSCLGERFGSFKFLPEKTFEKIRAFLRMLADVRKIARHFSVNPILPENPTDQELADLEMLDALLCGRPFVLDGQACNIEVSMTREEANRMLRDRAIDFGDLPISLRVPQALSIFGVPIVLDSVDIHVTHARLSIDRPALRRAAAKLGSQESLSIAFHGTPASSLAFLATLGQNCKQ